MCVSKTLATLIWVWGNSLQKEEAGCLFGSKHGTIKQIGLMVGIIWSVFCFLPWCIKLFWCIIYHETLMKYDPAVKFQYCIFYIRVQKNSITHFDHCGDQFCRASFQFWFDRTTNVPCRWKLNYHSVQFFCKFDWGNSIFWYPVSVDLTHFWFPLIWMLLNFDMEYIFCLFVRPRFCRKQNVYCRPYTYTHTHTPFSCWTLIWKTFFVCFLGLDFVSGVIKKDERLQQNELGLTKDQQTIKKVMIYEWKSIPIQKR